MGSTFERTGVVYMKEPHKKIFYRTAEVCPQCGAIESFRKGAKGWQRKLENGDKITHVSCKTCDYQAIRWVRIKRINGV